MQNPADNSYQRLVSSLQRMGYQGFRLELEQTDKTQGALEYRVYGYVLGGQHDVRFGEKGDKYLYVGPVATAKEAKQEAKLQAMESILWIAGRSYEPFQK